MCDCLSLSLSLSRAVSLSLFPSCCLSPVMTPPLHLSDLLDSEERIVHGNICVDSKCMQRHDLLVYVCVCACACACACVCAQASATVEVDMEKAEKLLVHRNDFLASLNNDIKPVSDPTTGDLSDQPALRCM